MSIRAKAYIAGAFEHPTRKAENKTVAQLHAECARGALLDAGLSLRDVDGYFCAGDAPGMGGLSMVDYLGLKVRHVDSTDVGGSSYLLHVSHAAQAIAARASQILPRIVPCCANRSSARIVAIPFTQHLRRVPGAPRSSTCSTYSRTSS